MKWVRPAALPTAAGKLGSNGRLEAGVGVRGDQLHSTQPSGNETTEKCSPGSFVLAGKHIYAQNLPVAITVDTSGDHCHYVHHSSTFSTALSSSHRATQTCTVQWPVAEALYHRVQFLGQLRDLALAHSLKSQGMDQTIHTSCGYGPPPRTVPLVSRA